MQRPGDSSGALTASHIDVRTESQESHEADASARLLHEGLTIERPRSALHSGDFTQHASSARRGGDDNRSHGRRIADEDVFRSDEDQQSSWFATSPPRHFVTPYKFERRIPFPDAPDGYRSSPPSLSSSLSSSFVYKHPTSPLVQSESNNDANIDAMDLDPSTPSRMPRRQTLHNLYPSQNSASVPAQRIATIRRESTFPYQAHQPRRSLTSAPTLPWMPGSLQNTPPSGPRRMSVVALDSSSPLQRTSMVGSYEESILRGRMSTTPSKPLDFLAQIGVLGLGDNCKSSLRCPAHVTLPFPAVFYSYASTPHGRSPGASDDGPSPYVGQIDLENGLSSPDESRARRRSHQRSGSAAAAARRRRDGSVGATTDVDMSGVDISGATTTGAEEADSRRMANKQTRRHRGSTSSPKAPPGGSYRIPEKGQIQIIIKNQNKTAVKLFLVPYDLAGMEPCTKTFIRQRSYSGGAAATDDGGSGGLGAAAEDDKPVLRYLVHLHICCPARGRYYLYKSVRVVFANRVPDGKEKLRNEITLPEPRWTPYKAVRQMQHAPSAHAHPPHPHLLRFSPGHVGPTSSASAAGTSSAMASLYQQQQYHHQLSGSSAERSFGRRGPATFSSFGRPVARSSSPSAGSIGAGVFASASRAVPVAGFAPLSFAKGEYSGPAGAGVGSGADFSAAFVAEGLLSQRLRSLGMQGACRGEKDGGIGEEKE